MRDVEKENVVYQTGSNFWHKKSLLILKINIIISR